MNSTPSQERLVDQILPKLRPFQREAFEFATAGKKYGRQCAGAASDGTSNHSALPVVQHDRGRILLADEMGLGKTVTSLAIMSHYEHEWNPLLILCPPSLRFTWPSEIEKFLPSLPARSVYVAKGFSDIDFIKQKDVRIVIVTYSLLQNRSAVARILQEKHFHCVIADESHNLKQKSSQRAQLILPILRRARRLVLISGTPALARPVELWTQLSCLAPKLFGNWTTFTQRYCNPTRKSIGGGRFHLDYNGSSHLNELNAKLRTVMVRRLKSHVLSELPPKQRSIVYVAIAREEKETCQRVMLEMKEKKKASSSTDLLFDDQTQQTNNRFEGHSAVMAAYQQSGIGKAAAVADYLLDWLAGSSDHQKILVFAHHKAVLDVIDQKLLQKYPNSHIRIDGSVQTAVRHQLVTKFENCARCRVGLLSMKATGTGLTLTAASTVLFAELHWTPGDLAQCEDRVHRISQKNPVNVVYMVCKDEKLSLDMSIWNMLGKKIGTIGQAIDGNTDTPYLYNASTSTMNETRDGEKPSVPSAKPGESVQDELTSFFATASADEARRRNRVPAKGTIESYFQKVPSKKASSSSKPRKGVGQSVSSSVCTWTCDVCQAVNSKAVSEIGWLACEACRNLYKVPDSKPAATVSKQPASKRRKSSSVTFQQQPASTASNKTPRPESKPTSQKRRVTWNCVGCTFINDKPTNSTGWYACEICGQEHLPFLLDDQPTFTSTPASTKLSTKPVPVTATLSSSRRGADKSRTSAASEVIVLDGADDLESSCSSHRKRPSKKAKGSSAEREIIVLDDTPEKKPAESSSKGSSGTIHHRRLLKFSVSQNSGRIAIHLVEIDSSGATAVTLPSRVNFDIRQVLKKEAADKLLEAGASKRFSEKRGTGASTANDFDRAGVEGVLREIEKAHTNHLASDQRNSYADEIMEFVTGYLSLETAAKKAVRESAEAFPAAGLSQAVAQLLMNDVASSSFTKKNAKDRYAQCAKDRALEKLNGAGVLTESDQAVLDGRACAGCGNVLHVASRRAVSVVYCSQACAEESRLRRGGMFASSRIRSAVFALEGGVCQICSLNAHSLYQQIVALEEPVQRENKLVKAGFRLPKSRQALENLLNRPNEGRDFWQVDHIHAVAEGGGGCGLENLRTLCVPCHEKETAKLKARLKLQSPSVKGGGEQSRGTQVDIRSAFAAQAAGQKQVRK